MNCSDCGGQVSFRAPRGTGKCRTCSKRGKPYMPAFTRIKRNAVLHGVTCELTYEQFINSFVGKDCHYCGSTVPWVPFYTADPTKSPQAYFLDKKENLAGYSVENCVVCCKFCNWVKGARFTYDEFMLLAPGLREVMKRRGS